MPYTDDFLYIPDDSDMIVYSDKVYELVDEYIDTLDHPEELSKSNSTLFSGLIKYIYMYYFKDHKIPFEDIERYDEVWNIYTSLCYKYNKYPSILEFSILTGTSYNTFYDWMTSKVRMYIYKDSNGNIINNILAWTNTHIGETYNKVLSYKHMETVKKWKTECEQSLVRGATESNKVGCMFLLKAKHGYVETAPLPVANPIQVAQMTPEQIAQEYGQEDQAAIPEIPG